MECRTQVIAEITCLHGKVTGEQRAPTRRCSQSWQVAPHGDSPWAHTVRNPLLCCCVLYPGGGVCTLFLTTIFLGYTHTSSQGTPSSCKTNIYICIAIWNSLHSVPVLCGLDLVPCRSMQPVSRPLYEALGTCLSSRTC